MASGKKRRGPKPRPGAAAKRSTPSPKPRPAQGAATRASRGGISKQWWIVIGVFVLALAVGIVVQSSRSKTENTKVVAPKHALGPNQSEIEGDASAPVLVQEYADFQCPACRSFHERLGPTVDELVEDGEIRFVYSYFPFLGEESVRAAAAAVCAGDQDRFFPYADVLYTNQAAENSGFLTTDRLVTFGEDAGITGRAFDTFEKCVRVDTYDGFARRQAENASKRGISQTPTLLLTGPDGQTFEMSPEQLAGPAQFEAAVADAASGKS